MMWGWFDPLYLLFVASWFLHLPARVPTLGAIRLDLILVVLLAVLLLAVVTFLCVGDSRSCVSLR